MFKVIPLSPTKLPSLGFLGFVTSGVSTLKGGFLLFFKGLVVFTA